MPGHGHHARTVASVACAAITVSDTRSVADDESGRRLTGLLVGAGHTVVRYEILPDDPTVVTDAVTALLHDAAVDAILLNGGTGLAPRDTTFEAVRGLLDKEIPGFGELFRSLSYAEIGAAAMLSRATAGVARGTIVVSMPGSPPAVELAMTRLVLPQLGHMVFLVRGP
jgi:molybdenum cofactor biosynthesis protein B